MKRHVQLPGIRLWAGEDWLEIQNETLQALDGFFGQYGMYILSGCTVSGEGDARTVSPGVVVLEGQDQAGKNAVMIVRFAGVQNTALPLYLTLAHTVETRDYEDDVERPVAYEYYAQASQNVPVEGVPYLLLDENTPRFVDVIQDSEHRFMSDLDREKWDNILRLAMEYTDSIVNVDPTLIGEMRSFTPDIDFDDPDYLPMDGSRVLVSDHPDMPFSFPPGMYEEDVTPTPPENYGYWQIMGMGRHNGEYIGLDCNFGILRSSDLRNWTNEQVGLPTHMTCFACGNGVCLACGQGFVYRSTDTYEWTKVSTLSFEQIRFADGVFVGIAGNTIYTSYDGLTFEKRAVPASVHSDLAYHDGLWVACCGYGVAISTNLVTWAFKGPTSGYSHCSVQYCGNKWICGSVAGTLLISEDAETWRAVSGTGVNYYIYRAAYYDGKYILFARGVLYLTEDFVTWTIQPVINQLFSGGTNIGVLYTDDDEMLAYFHGISLWNIWYQLPNLSSADEKVYLKTYDQ